MRRFPLAAFAAALTAAISFGCLPLPFFWTAAAWSALLLAAAVRSRGAAARIICVNACLFLLLLAGLELYCSLDAASAPQKTVEFSSASGKPFMARHPLLGYAPVPDNRVVHRETYPKGERLEAVYTIGADGLRAAMPENSGDPPQREAILFFGGSFTFGEGVADRETLPYRLGEKTAWRYRIYNFGFEGYGPHQMLAALENGIVSGIVHTPPAYIFYQAITDHLNRVRRGHPWIRYGPRYELKNGAPVYAGQFAESPSGGENAFLRMLNRSAIVRRVRTAVDRRRQAAEVQRLFVAIVARARDLCRQTYPGSRFAVILWSRKGCRDSGYDICRVTDELRARGIPVLGIHDIIPDYDRRREVYEIPRNLHPSRAAYDAIASYLAQEVVR